jgi:hypothetical protein
LPDDPQDKEKVIDRSPPRGDAFTRFVVTTHVTKRQKEVTIAMATGRYAKNELVLHLSGLTPDFDINQAVTEASEGMRAMEEANPISLPLSKPAKQLVDKTLKAGEKEAQEAD